MSDESDNARFSRRKLLGSVATVGAAGALGGAATSALLWDEEKFGNESNPNVLQGGKLDLKVDWESKYYDWIDNDGDGVIDNQGEGGIGANYPNGVSGGPTDQPGVLVELMDLKPGDLFETTFSFELYGNPAYLAHHLEIHSSSDNGINEPEDKVNGHDPDDSDGTEGGDLEDYVNVVVWHDDGDNLPDEIWAGEPIDWDVLRNPGQYEDATVNAERKAYTMAVAGASVDSTNTISGDPDVTFTDYSVFDSPDTQGFVFSGTLQEAHDVSQRWPGAVLSPKTGELQNYSTKFVEDDNDPTDDMYKCYAPTGNAGNVTEYLGFLAWLPRDIPGVNDNIIQSDTVEFQVGFEAIQCRHNPLKSPGANAPMDGTFNESDAENNALSPGGNGTAPNGS